MSAWMSWLLIQLLNNAPGETVEQLKDSCRQPDLVLAVGAQGVNQLMEGVSVSLFQIQKNSKKQNPSVSPFHWEV